MVLPRQFGALGAVERNSSYFAWLNFTTSDSTVFPMKLTSPCTTTYLSVEKVVPSGVPISCTSQKIENNYCKVSLNQ